MTTSAITLVLLVVSCTVAAEDTPEALFRDTVSQWRSDRSTWSPWIDFTTQLLQWFENTNDERRLRLEIIGGLEEGILAIEQATVAMGEGENMPRDVALSNLYAGYGRTLMALSARECLALALDPHTLLMGVEPIVKQHQQGSSPQHNDSNQLCLENAENALRNAATLDATNTHAQELLGRLTGEGQADVVHKRKPKEFVAELFDSFAATFDEKLVGSLGYKVPQLVGEAAKEMLRLRTKNYPSASNKSSYQAVLDAGCGTGLAGRFLRPLIDDGVGAHAMIGVDASSKMLEIAAKCTRTTGCGLKQADDKTGSNANDRPLYDGLYELDLEDMTLENTLYKAVRQSPGFDLIVAADVFVYFGSLQDLLLTFAKLSAGPGAALVFSCERPATDDEAPLGWRLLASGRFAHTKHHAVEAAALAGYELATYQEIVPRMEKGEEVRGHLFGFLLKDWSHAAQHTSDEL